MVALFCTPQHSLPPSAYATVKAYGNFDADRDALTLETAIKAKGRWKEAPRS